MGSDYSMSPPPAPSYAWVRNEDVAVLYVYDTMTYSDGMWHRIHEVPWTAEVESLMNAQPTYLHIHLPAESDFQFGETEDNDTIRELIKHRNDPREPDWEWEISRITSPNSSDVRDALTLAIQYGGIDGAHHKTWVIDQMVRKLAGSRYERLIVAAQYGEDGPDTYEWDEGIAP